MKVLSQIKGRRNKGKQVCDICQGKKTAGVYGVLSATREFAFPENAERFSLTSIKS